MPTLPSSLSSLQIVFTNNGKLWLWQNGKTTFLTDASDYSPLDLSPDGSSIAFKRHNSLWVINTDGTHERLVLSEDDFGMMEPQTPGVGLDQFEWIPGTHTILFNTILHLDYGLEYTDDLHAVDADIPQQKTLRGPGQGGEFILSPDGQRVALITPNKISLIKVDGSDYQTLLEYPSVSIPSEYAYYARPVWATDSQSLMVAIPPQDLHYGTQSPTTIWRLPIDGTTPILISQLTAGDAEIISPDFSKVASLRFIKQEAPYMVSELHISNIDGSEDTIYHTGVIDFQNWALDSEHFVLWLGDSHSYYLGNVGDELVPLTESSNVSGAFSWVDQSHFLYLTGQNGICELRLGVVGEPSILLAKAETTYSCLTYDFVQ